MKKICLLFCLGLMTLAACEKMVEIDFPANQIGTAQVFEDIHTANAALAGLYSDLRDGSVVAGAGFYAAGTLLASYTDDLDCYTDDQNGIVDIYLNQQQESNTVIASIWTVVFQQIYYANSIIYGADNSSALTVSDKNRIKGEALFIRSLLYFYLQQIFGDIPYTTSLDYEYNRAINKTESSEVLTLLLTDLNQAIDLLGDDYRDYERIFPNRKTAQLLLARIYLLQGEWTQAEGLADSVLKSQLYEFQTDLNEVFHKTGSHILWQLMPENSGDATQEAGFYYFSDSAPYSYTLSADLVNDFAANDLRKQEWMAEVTYDGSLWYRPFKYRNITDNTDEYSVVFRLEEAYFIKAEALARQNRFDDALPYLNATRERAGLTAVTSLTGDDFFTELLAEKRREFFCESGHRFLDLKRMGRLDELISVKPNWADNKKVWPLPQSELLLNPNLSPQNTGY